MQQDGGHGDGGGQDRPGRHAPRHGRTRPADDVEQARLEVAAADQRQQGPRCLGPLLQTQGAS